MKNFIFNFLLIVSLCIFNFSLISTTFADDRPVSTGSGQPTGNDRPVSSGSPSDRPVSTGSGASGVKESVTLQNPFAFKTVGQLMDKLLDIIIKVGSVIALFFIIYSGFLFVTAAGSEDKVASAKATFLWTIIGVAIVLGAKALSVLIQGTVNNITGQ